MHRAFSLSLEGTGAVSPRYDATDPRTGWSLALSGSRSGRPLDRSTWSGSAGLERFTELDGAVLHAGTVLRLRIDCSFTPRLWGAGDRRRLDLRHRGPGDRAPPRRRLGPGGGGDGWQAFAKASWAIVLPTANDGSPAADAALPAAFTLVGDTPGGWVTPYPADGASSTSKDGASGSRTPLNLDGERGGCFAFQAAFLGAGGPPLPRVSASIPPGCRRLAPDRCYRPPMTPANLARARRIVVLTGAGMGLASGIPTFRGTDPDAVWARDVTELGTRRYFEFDPAGSWRWYRARFGALARAEPNPGHHALVALERWARASGRDFLLVTQNIDTLHRRAGSEHLVEVHGRADRLRCSARGCANAAPLGSIDAAAVSWEEFTAHPVDENVPRCPACGARLRPHVLWFDEYYTEHVDYQFDRAMAAFRRADLLLCVVTSFSVGITAAALESRAEKWSLDPSEADPPCGVRPWRAAQEVALPALVAGLG